jgi:hypothetical protein
VGVVDAVTGAKLDGLAVQRVAVGVGPGGLAFEEFGLAGEAFGFHEFFERSDPVVVVFAAILVGFAEIDGRGEFGGQCFGPFLPRKVALRGETDGEGEGLGLPGFGEDGAVLVAG